MIYLNSIYFYRNYFNKDKTNFKEWKEHITKNNFCVGNHCCNTFVQSKIWCALLQGVLTSKDSPFAMPLVLIRKMSAPSCKACVALSFYIGNEVIKY